jgi:hypothetical protein
MKYITGILGIILIALVGIFMVTSLTRTNRSAVPSEPEVVLSDFAATDSQVVYFQGGRIVAEEEHRSIRITVSAKERKIQVYKGYNGAVIESKTYANTSASYDAFLAGLQNVGFTMPREIKSGPTDPEGACPLGRRYIFTLKNDNDIVHETWSATCRQARGDFGGRRGAVDDLFRAQIPDYRDLTRNVRL